MAAPLNSTVAKSAAQIDKQALAYRATETSAPVVNIHIQQPAKLQSAPTKTAATTPSRNETATETTDSNTHAPKRAVQPVGQKERIVVSAANLVADPAHVTSIPADGLSPEFHQVSMIVHKRTRVRHKRRNVRHGRIGLKHSRRGRHHLRQRHRARSLMAHAAAEPLNAAPAPGCT